MGLLQRQTSEHRTGRDGRETGRIDHREFGIMLTAAFGDLPSVDASGQLDVRDENVDDLSSAPRQRLLAIGRNG
jgi:hypothetical protein